MKVFLVLMPFLIASCGGGSSTSDTSQKISTAQKQNLANLNVKPVVVAPETPKYTLFEKPVTLQSTLVKVWEGQVSGIENLRINLKDIANHVPQFTNTNLTTATCEYTNPASCPAPTPQNPFPCGVVFGNCTNNAAKDSVNAQYGFMSFNINPSLVINYTERNFANWKINKIVESINLSDLKMKFYFNDQELVINQKQILANNEHEFFIKFDTAKTGNLKIIFEKQNALYNDFTGVISPTVSSCKKEFENKTFNLFTLNGDSKDSNGNCLFGKTTYIYSGKTFTKTAWSSTEKWSLAVKVVAQAKTIKELLPLLN